MAAQLRLVRRGEVSHSVFLWLIFSLIGLNLVLLFLIWAAGMAEESTVTPQPNLQEMLLLEWGKENQNGG